MVTVILGVLATIAMPQYLKVVERARMTEATLILGQLRASQVRYKSQTGKFATRLANLDVDLADVSGKMIYEYFEPLLDGKGFLLTARRKGPEQDAPVLPSTCMPNYVMHMDQDGTIFGADCQLTE